MYAAGYLEDCSGFADCRIRWLYLSGFTEQTGTGLVAGAYIPTTEMQNITLPDGTQVMINSESTLLYPQQFTRGRQSLCLSGWEKPDFKVRRDEATSVYRKVGRFPSHGIGNGI